MQRAAFLGFALLATTNFAAAAPMTEAQAIVLGKSLCAARIPNGVQAKWLAVREAGNWMVLGVSGSKEKPRSVAVIVPINGPAPRECGRFSVRIVSDPKSR